jgi:histidinol dehydrogenase
MVHGSKDVIPRCDFICGPGNKWVATAKSAASSKRGIDMLAGPCSEVLVTCDDEPANSKVVTADLIAQAKHNVVGRAILLSTSSDVIKEINEEVELQIAALPKPNRSTELGALQQSFAVKCESTEQRVTVSDDIATEHLEILNQKQSRRGQGVCQSSWLVCRGTCG